MGLLLDLQELASRGADDDFGGRLDALRQAHAKKTSFITELRRAGL